MLLDSAAVAASYMISLVCYLPSLFQYEDRPVLGYPFTPGNDWWGHTLSYMYVPKTNQYWISYSFFEEIHEALGAFHARRYSWRQHNIRSH